MLQRYTLSHLTDISYGVQQGSGLGPLVFLLYINDVPNVSLTMFFVLFADDTDAFYSDNLLQTLIHFVNPEIQLVLEWFNINKFMVSLEKTNSILFILHRRLEPVDYSMTFIISLMELLLHRLRGSLCRPVADLEKSHC